MHDPAEARRQLTQSLSSAERRALAEDVAGEVLHYLDVMYPGVWIGVPRAARRSLRTVIIRHVLAALVRGRQL